MLRSIGRTPLSLTAGRGDGAHYNGGPDPRDPSFPKGRTLAAPSFRTDGKQEEILPIRSHDFH
jgi:error-prone DNA polymerase